MNVEILMGEKFKELEVEYSRRIETKTRVVIRFDGKNFSSYTRRFKKPYDLDFMEAMDETTRQLCAQMTGVHFAYTQSDEISVVFSNLSTHVRNNTDMWMGGRVEKMLSVGAATVSTIFGSIVGVERGERIPVFDARVHLLASEDEAEEYVRWRRFDAQKNSVTMAAQSMHSHKELMGASSKDRLKLLEGTDLERLPEGFYNGRISNRETYMKFTSQGNALRSRWVSNPADRNFMESEFPKLNR